VVSFKPPPQNETDVKNINYKNSGTNSQNIYSSILKDNAIYLFCDYENIIKIFCSSIVVLSDPHKENK
jgi:hypothetical protein